MAEFTSALPDPETMAQFCVAVLAVIVAWDAWWLGRQRIDIPELGDLSNGGYAGNLINPRKYHANGRI